MASDAISPDQCGKAIWPGSRCHFLDFAGSSRCVIRALASAADIVLKFARVFSKIVEQSNNGAQARCSKFFGPPRCQLRYGFQMRGQRLPCIPISTSNRMSEEHLDF